MSENKPGFRDILKLNKLERLIINYFVKNISVGEIIAVLELRDEVKRLKDSELVSEFDDVIIEFEINRALARLVEKGLIEHTTGCYNLAQHLQKKIIEKTGGLNPGFHKTIEELMD